MKNRSKHMIILLEAIENEAQAPIGRFFGSNDLIYRTRGDLPRGFGNHMYLLSYDKIEVDDYIYVEEHTTYQKCVGFEDNGDIICDNGLTYQKDKCNKITITTNNELKIEVDGHRGELLPDVSFDIKLPKPTEEFIKSYIMLHNDGHVNVVGFVEMNDMECNEIECEMYSCDIQCANPKPRTDKTDKNNFANIGIIKKFYHHTEVEKLCKKPNKDECIKFTKWIQNHWYMPYSKPNEWVLKRNESDLLSDDKIYTTEELYGFYKVFKATRGTINIPKIKP